MWKELGKAAERAGAFVTDEQSGDAVFIAALLCALVFMVGLAVLFAASLFGLVR